MPGEDKSALQRFVGKLVASLPEARDWYDKRYRDRTDTTTKPLYDMERGKSRNPSRSVLRNVAELTGQPMDLFLRAIDGEDVEPVPVSPALQEDSSEPGSGTELTEAAVAGPVMVRIQHIDLAFGLGASFTDNPIEVEVLDFPRQWIRTITYSPPELLTWTRGKGDSMRPTIDDGDLVLLDRSQRDVREQDGLWAITVGDTASIKRLRKKGDRFQIFSDNPAVPPDEEPIDFVNVVARVVFVGHRT